ncbi:MAG: GvpL/GvpF family gas vesicle protein, partial [Acidobacteria bacterium]|nr:GvpL/GvpF family gas vesicle protein [Acidobacteriota bacterium]
MAKTKQKQKPKPRPSKATERPKAKPPVKANPSARAKRPVNASGPAARERVERPSAGPPASRGKLERVRMPPTQSRSARPEVDREPDDSNEGKYVYCIIKSERPLSFGALGIGIEPAHCRTVHYRDIAAVVSNTPMVVQDPTRDNVLAHQRVNETVMQQHTVIPMSFGTVFKT